MVPSDVRVFFGTRTLSQLLAVRECVLHDMTAGRDREVATFVCGLALGLLHGHSQLSLSVPCNQVFAMAPNYVRRYVKEHALRKPDRDVRKCLLNKALELLPGPKKKAKSTVFERPAHHCDRYLGKRAGSVSLVLTSPPYLNRQTYIKDSWLRLWFLGRDRAELMNLTLETGNVLTFIDRIKEALASMWRCLRINGTMVLVCGKAKVRINGKDVPVRVGELCLYALNECEQTKGFRVERVIMDRKLMKRGSYFAVHHGRSANGDGRHGPRYGEDEILVVRRTS